MRKQPTVHWPCRPRSRIIRGRVNTAYKELELKRDLPDLPLEEEKTKTFGHSKDSGLLTYCPNTDGSCKRHHDHINFTRSELKTNVIKKHNNKIILAMNGLDDLPEEEHDLVASQLYNKRKKRAVQVQSNIAASQGLTFEELEESSNEIADQINAEDWSFIKKLSNTYMKIHDKYNTGPDSEEIKTLKDEVLAYLESDGDVVKQTRDFLGDGADLEDFAELLVRNAGGMTRSQRWNEGKSFIRVLGTRFDNDMNKKRYVASVLFFGGRCCYCNRPFGAKRPPTAEHLTPLSPEKEDDIVGATKYGNMALACDSCNRARGNKELTSWIQSSQQIKKAEKHKVLGRIKAFRSFALYEDYTPEESQKIRKIINETVDTCNAKRDSYRANEITKGDYKEYVIGEIDTAITNIQLELH